MSHKPDQASLSTSSINAQQHMTCSDLARSNGESIIGTAAWARSWLLIENRDAWPSHAVNDLLPSAIRTRIAEAGWNAQFVREFDDRRESDSRGKTWRLWFVDSSKNTIWLWESDNQRNQLSTIEALLNGQPAPGVELKQPFLLVCTNGKRDACCAVSGREILKGLTDASRNATPTPVAVESTHLGGHRFAGVVVALPHSYQYRCDSAEHAKQILAAAQQGVIHPIGLRGHTAKQSPAQVAEIAVREKLGIWNFSSSLSMECKVSDRQAEVRGVIGTKAFTASLTLIAGEPRRESCSGDAKPLHFWHCTNLTIAAS